MLNFVNFSVLIKERLIVDNFSFLFEKGKFYTILGRSGSGKTTLFSVPFMDTKIKKMKYIDVRGEVISLGKVVIIPQKPYRVLNPYIKIWKQTKNITGKHTVDFSRLLVADSTLNKYAYEISDGTVMKILFSWCEAIQPDIIIADEINTYLDLWAQGKVLEELERLKNEIGVTIIFITHNISLTLNISDQILVLDKGKLIEVIKNGEPFKSDIGKNLLYCAKWPEKI